MPTKKRRFFTAATPVPLVVNVNVVVVMQCPRKMNRMRKFSEVR
jgi:hypothetical protein